MKHGTLLAACVVILLAAAQADAQTLARYGRYYPELGPVQADMTQAPTQAPIQAPVQAPKGGADLGCGCGMNHSTCSGWWSNYSRPRPYLGLARCAPRGCGVYGVGSCGGAGGWSHGCGAKADCCHHHHLHLRPLFGCGLFGWGSSDCGCGEAHGKVHESHTLEAPMDVPTPVVDPST